MILDPTIVFRVSEVQPSTLSSCRYASTKLMIHVRETAIAHGWRIAAKAIVAIRYKRKVEGLSESSEVYWYMNIGQKWRTYDKSTVLVMIRRVLKGIGMMTVFL